MLLFSCYHDIRDPRTCLPRCGDRLPSGGWGSRSPRRPLSEFAGALSHVHELRLEPTVLDNHRGNRCSPDPGLRAVRRADIRDLEVASPRAMRAPPARPIDGVTDLPGVASIRRSEDVLARCRR